MGIFETLFVAAALPVVKLVLLASGLLSYEGRKVLSAMAYNVFVPALNSSCLASSITPSRLLHWWPLVVNLLFSTAIGGVLGIINAALVKPEPWFRPHTVAAVMFGNVGNLPLVIVATLAQSSASILGGVDPDEATKLAISYVILGLLTPILTQPTIGYKMLSKGAESLAREERNAPLLACDRGKAIAGGPDSETGLRHATGAGSTAHQCDSASHPTDSEHASLLDNFDYRLPDLSPAGPAPSGRFGEGGVDPEQQAKAPFLLNGPAPSGRFGEGCVDPEQQAKAPLSQNGEVMSTCTTSPGATPMSHASMPSLLEEPTGAGSSMPPQGEEAGCSISCPASLYVSSPGQPSVQAAGGSTTCPSLVPDCQGHSFSDGSASSGMMHPLGLRLSRWTPEFLSHQDLRKDPSLASMSSTFLDKSSPSSPHWAVQKPDGLPRPESSPDMILSHQDSQLQHSSSRGNASHEQPSTTRGCTSSTAKVAVTGGGQRMVGRSGFGISHMASGSGSATGTGCYVWLKSASRRGRRVGKAILKELKSPPILSTLVGILIGCIQPVQALLFAPNAPLKVVADTVTMLGDCAIPVMIISLGATLSNGPGASKVPFRIIASVGVCRLIILPLVGLFIVMGSYHLGLFKAPDPIFLLVLLIQNTAPTAIMVHTMSAVHQNGDQEVSTILFWQYLVGIVTIPPYLLWFMYMVKDKFHD
eukprot:gene12698-15930_t